MYRATSIALALVLSLFWLPQQGFELAAPTFTYADGRSVSYPVDYTTSGYALGLTQNGDSLISDSAIQFERKEDGGGSVFTNNKINLGGNLAFSTAFSFDITPPSTLSEGMSGIVFTLQDKGNTAYAKDFQYDIDTITPSLNIAFVTEYSSAGVLMAASENETAASDISDGPRLMGDEPQLQRVEKAVLYVNGDYANGLTLYEQYLSTDDSHHFDILPVLIYCRQMKSFLSIYSLSLHHTTIDHNLGNSFIKN